MCIRDRCFLRPLLLYILFVMTSFTSICHLLLYSSSCQAHILDSGTRRTNYAYLSMYITSMQRILVYSIMALYIMSSSIHKLYINYTSSIMYIIQYIISYTLMYIPVAPRDLRAWRARPLGSLIVYQYRICLLYTSRCV